MPACVPVRDMKSTADFVELVERESDVTITKNGYCAIHCLSDSEYRLVQEERARYRLLSRMLLAEREAADGDTKDYDSLTATLKAEYDL